MVKKHKIQPHYSNVFFYTALLFMLLGILAFTEILSKNSGYNPSKISKTEMNINSPLTDTSSKPRDQVIDYKVQPDDNLYNIAEKFQIDINSIKWNNDLQNDSVYTGQVLKIPPVTGIVHTVQQGETIQSIAQKYNTDPQNIINWPYNNFVDLNTFTLAPGQTLIVPNGVR